MPRIRALQRPDNWWFVPWLPDSLLTGHQADALAEAVLSGDRVCGALAELRSRSVGWVRGDLELFGATSDPGRLVDLPMSNPRNGLKP